MAGLPVVADLLKGRLSRWTGFFLWTTVATERNGLSPARTGSIADAIGKS